MLMIALLVSCGNSSDSEVPGRSSKDGGGGARNDGGGYLVDSGTLVDSGSLVDSGIPQTDARLGPDATPNSAMSFFVTSTGSGASGGNLGGLAGADAKCQSLATNGGASSRTWHAYLSTGTMGPGPIGAARDRIGAGPWHNQQGTVVAANVAALHANGILGSAIFDELGGTIPGNEHDVLTGTQANGSISRNSETCDNWTNGTVNSQAEVGHADTMSGDGESWNGQHSGSCDQASLMGNAGAGRLYCFAID